MELAEELTAVLLVTEGGGDTRAGRAGSLVRYREIDRGEWFVGGVNDNTYLQGKGMFHVEMFVPEGLLDQQRKSQAHKATNEALARVTAVAADQTRYFWIQVTEWPEGSLASGGATLSLFGLAKRAGHPTEHPVIEFPRAYFEAKTPPVRRPRLSRVHRWSPAGPILAAAAGSAGQGVPRLDPAFRREDRSRITSWGRPNER